LHKNKDGWKAALQEGFGTFLNVETIVEKWDKKGRRK
jgi:hypothetical protein